MILQVLQNNHLKVFMVRDSTEFKFVAFQLIFFPLQYVEYFLILISLQGCAFFFHRMLSLLQSLIALSRYFFTQYIFISCWLLLS